MINDPLLPNPPAADRQTNMKSPQQTPRTPKAKRRPPARSAKILTVGLSTTAMLGMTTGYAFADLAQKNANPDPVDSSTIATTPVALPEVAIQATPTPAPRVSPTPVAPTPSAQSSQNATPTPVPQPGTTPKVTPQPSATQEVVIDVPVATPGNGNSSWNNQKSSGSN